VFAPQTPARATFKKKIFSKFKSWSAEDFSNERTAVWQRTNLHFIFFNCDTKCNGLDGYILEFHSSRVQPAVFHTFWRDSILFPTILKLWYALTLIRFDFDTFFVSIRYVSIHIDLIHFDTYRFYTFWYVLILYISIRIDSMRFDTYRFNTFVSIFRIDSIRFDFDTCWRDSILFPTI
jgi:hypothetical protein